jgi:hypothetical protein
VVGVTSSMPPHRRPVDCFSHMWYKLNNVMIVIYLFFCFDLTLFPAVALRFGGQPSKSLEVEKQCHRAGGARRAVVGVCLPLIRFSLLNTKPPFCEILTMMFFRCRRRYYSTSHRVSFFEFKKRRLFGVDYRTTGSIECRLLVPGTAQRACLEGLSCISAYLSS